MHTIRILTISIALSYFLLVPAMFAENSELATQSSEEDMTASVSYEYIVLATTKTSTMEKELNEGADAGHRFRDVMGGLTSFGGSEVVIVMSKDDTAPSTPRFQYKLLATGKTSTMQKELQDAGNAGFQTVGQTVFSSTFGGQEVVVIMERDIESSPQTYEYKLLATKKTGTLEKELIEAGEAGFDIVGLTVAKTRFGGAELLSIMRRERPE